MKTKIILFVAFTIIFAVGLVALRPFTQVSQAAEAITCKLPGFTAAVQQGPDKGLQVTGALELSVDSSGAVTGKLTALDPKDTTTIAITGQANGRAINLAFDMGKAKDSDAHKYVFGVGTFVNDIKSCNGSVGGPLVGPNPGDAGDWGDCDPACRPGLVCCKPGLLVR